MNLFWDSEASGRRLLWLSWLVLAVLVAVVLLTRTLTPIDETRYVGAAWEMWLRGDFLVPFKNGEPYSHKPPFFFWMFHVGWALFGINEWWPRLVAPLFSAGASGLVFLLARQDGTRPFAWLALALVALAPEHVRYSSELKQYSLDALVAAEFSNRLRTQDTP